MKMDEIRQALIGRTLPTDWYGRTITSCKKYGNEVMILCHNDTRAHYMSKERAEMLATEGECERAALGNRPKAITPTKGGEA